MTISRSLQLRVGVDVGTQSHSVAVGLTDGSLLEAFEIPHTAAGFEDFFTRIERHARRYPELPMLAFAFGVQADALAIPSECLLIAISGHWRSRQAVLLFDSVQILSWREVR